MIPRKIIQFWDQKKIPDEILALMMTWKDQNKDFSYHCFCEEEALHFIRNNFGDNVSKLFSNARFAAMKSDIFRVAYCLINGGVYIDAGSRCFRSIFPLLDEPDKLILMRKWHGGVCNGFIISPPNHMVLRELWNRIISNISLYKYENNVWQATGPGNYNADIVQNDKKTLIIKQSDLSKYFKWANKLGHKGDSHWSKAQKKTGIYYRKDLMINKG